MMEECVVPTHTCTIELQVVRINLLEAGALQKHEHETSRLVSGIDTTSSQLIADLIAKYGFRASIHPGPNSEHSTMTSCRSTSKMTLPTSCCSLKATRSQRKLELGPWVR